MCVCAHVCACTQSVYDDELCHDIQQSWVYSQLLFMEQHIPVWINRNIRWVKGHTFFFWRGEVFSFHITVLNWREPSGKRRGLRRLEQVSFMKNRMWKKKELVKSARVFKHYGIFWSSFGVCEFLLRWLLNAVFPLFNGQSGPRVVLFSRLKTSALERCLYIAETLH